LWNEVVVTDIQYRLRPILQLSGVIDNDIPPPRAPAHSAALPTVPLAGPSRKRKAEVIDIDDEEVDAKPEVKPKHKDRVTWLEVGLINIVIQDLELISLATTAEGQRAPQATKDHCPGGCCGFDWGRLTSISFSSFVNSFWDYNVYNVV
jgi:hypothetical protein